MAKHWRNLLLAVALVSGAWGVSPAIAGTCASDCGPKPLQFIPGQQIKLQVINRTASIIEIQKVYGTDPVALRPGQEITIDQWGGTAPNISLLFWDVTGLPLKVLTQKPDGETLRLELRPGGRPPGDRSVYVLNDGRVAVY